jgi:hypothetical protein
MCYENRVVKPAHALSPRSPCKAKETTPREIRSRRDRKTRSSDSGSLTKESKDVGTESRDRGDEHGGSYRGIDNSAIRTHVLLVLEPFDETSRANAEKLPTTGNRWSFCQTSQFVRRIGRVRSPVSDGGLMQRRRFICQSS